MYLSTLPLPPMLLAAWAAASPFLADEPAPAILQVADFGAVGDAKTDDGPAIRRCLAEAVALGRPAEVRFEPRVYRIGPRDHHWSGFDIHHARNLTVEGNGATLLLHPHNCGFLLYRCEGVILRGFAIDYDPLPYTQGVVVELGPGNGAFTVRIDEGYPIPERIESGLRHGAFIEAETGRYTGHWLYLGSVERVKPGERLCRITAKAGDEGRVAGAHVGEHFVFGITSMTEEMRQSRFVMGQEPHHRGVFLSNPAGTIQIMLSRDCRVESMDHYMSIGMAYRLTGTENVTLRRIRILRKPGTDRLVASLSDGFHCKNNRVGPFIEGCTFEALLDDSINLSTMSDDIMERLGPNTFLTLYSDIVWYDTPIAVGDTVQLFDPVRAAFLGEAEVTGVEFVGNRQRRVTLDRVPEGVVDAKAAGREQATKLYIKQVTGAVVRDCVFRTQMKTAMVLRTPGLCEGNSIEDCFFGVHSHNSPQFGEGPIPYDLTILGNTFRRVGIAAIAALRLGPGPLQPAGGPVRIEGNSFVQSDGSAISLTNLRDVRIEGNSIHMHAATPERYGAIQLRNCADVAVRGCRIIDPRVPPAEAIRITEMPLEAVELSDNVITQ